MHRSFPERPRAADPLDLDLQGDERGGAADVDALAARNISMDTLRAVIAAANVNSAKGSFDGPTRSWTRSGGRWPISASTAATCAT